MVLEFSLSRSVKGELQQDPPLPLKNPLWFEKGLESMAMLANLLQSVRTSTDERGLIYILHLYPIFLPSCGSKNPYIVLSSILSEQRQPCKEV